MYIHKKEEILSKHWLYQTHQNIENECAITKDCSEQLREENETFQFLT